MHNKNYTLSMWLQYLEKLNKKKIFNLSELKYIAKKLGVLHSKAFVFTVAGTNGKGTTCATLEQLLLDSGYTVGVYSSPHLINYIERVKINGHFIHESQHIDSFRKIEFEKGSILLTYFEFITLSALILFKQYSLDIIILEVGLGGRLDATNIINSHVSLITNIGLDHTHLLGKDRLSIAREKSGIFRKNKISVIGEKNIPHSIYEIAEAKKTILKRINVDWFYQKNDNNWNFFHSCISLYNLPITNIPLSNISIALAALYYGGFKINEKVIRNSILKIQLLGRFQIISFFPHIILDVAHNPDAAYHLSKKIKKIDIKGKIYAIIGTMKDKDILGIVNPLKDKINYWYASPLKTNRTASIKQLQNNLPKNNTYLFASIYEAWKEVCVNTTNQDGIIIFGSFLTVSEFIFAQKIHNRIKILNNIIVENLCI